MKRKTFTLIELLVVIAIIAILAAILLPALQSARMRAQSGSCSSNLKNLASVASQYRDDNHGQWPAGTAFGNPGTIGPRALPAGFQWPSCMVRGKYISDPRYDKTSWGEMRDYSCPTIGYQKLTVDGKPQATPQVYGTPKPNRLDHVGHCWQLNMSSLNSTDVKVNSQSTTATGGSMPIKKNFSNSPSIRLWFADTAYFSSAYPVVHQRSVFYAPGDGFNSNFPQLYPVHNGRVNFACQDGHAASSEPEGLRNYRTMYGTGGIEGQNDPPYKGRNVACTIGKYLADDTTPTNEIKNCMEFLYY